jgi:hypothetical protein
LRTPSAKKSWNSSKDSFPSSVMRKEGKRLGSVELRPARSGLHGPHHSAPHQPISSSLPHSTLPAVPRLPGQRQRDHCSGSGLTTPQTDTDGQAIPNPASTPQLGYGRGSLRPAPDKGQPASSFTSDGHLGQASSTI